MYIAGFVERHLIQKTKCEDCCKTLNTDEKVSCQLIDQKNRGGLRSPQTDIYKICHIVEKEIRASNLSGNFYSIIFNMSMRQIAKEKLFESLPMQHIMNADVMFNHRTLLIRSVVEYFLKIRLNHIGKTNSQNLSRENVRQKYTKLILFGGQ